MTASSSALRALAHHLEAVSQTSRRHGGHGWTYDDEIIQLNAAATAMDELRKAGKALLAACPAEAVGEARANAAAHMRVALSL